MDDGGGVGGGGLLRNLGADELFSERARFYQDFLERDYGNNEYKNKIRKMLEAGARRLIVSINDMRAYNLEYATGILKNPVDFIPPFDKALRDVALAMDNFAECLPKLTKEGRLRVDDLQFAVGFDGSFGDHVLSPRKLSAIHLGMVVCLEGIVTKCGLVRPKVHKSVHYCEKTEMFHMREYRDGSALGHALPTGQSYLKEDDNGNPLTTEYGYCVYRDFQSLTLQEMPERSPAGQMPRPVEVFLNDDLVDLVKPGDRVQIIGVYRCLQRAGGGNTSAKFRTIVLANHIRHLGREAQSFQFSELDITNIRKIAKRGDAFDLLAKSLAPSIFGHEMIKKAILLMMLGGMEKNLPNGTHIRGDINILMIGDPSTAKSQMLRFVLNIAPLAIATTGRGSSGVGLTAAVTTDKDTGERTLEAGAMVLADRGVVCIDEFDKMSDIDRVAIHEVMEQQTVTIAKAGIHTSLNARCSVVAAANPAFGRYDNEKSPSANIPLPDSLLSRFDLLFVVLDNMSDEHNRTLADHVVRLHQYVPPGLEEGAPITDNTIAGIFNTATETETQSGEVWVRYNKLLHMAITPTVEPTPSGRKKKNAKPKVEILSIAFMKKFIHYAKNMIRPKLTEEARDAISEAYGRLRMEKDGREEKYRTVPITARTLETLIRLSTAHAKSRLSKEVEKEDTDVAVAILEFALYQKVEKKKARTTKRMKVNENDSEEEEEDEDDEDEDEDPDNWDGGDGDEGGNSGKAGAKSAKKKSSKSQSSRAASTVGAGATESMTGSMSSQDRLGLLAGLGGASTQASTSRPRDSQMPSGNGSMSGMEVEMGEADQIDDERYHFFKNDIMSKLNLELRTEDATTISLIDLMTRINRSLPMSRHFQGSEIKAAVKRIAEEVTSFMYDADTESLILV